MPRTFVSPVMLGLSFLSFAAAASDEPKATGPLDATVMVDAGGFFLTTDIRVRLDGNGSGTVGDSIDFDDTFGIARFDRFRVDGQWRIAGKHSVRATYFKNDRNGSREVERDIHFGDETYPIGTTTTAVSELQVLQLSYDYAFRRRDNYELAAGIGVHVLDASLALRATVAAAGGSASRELDQRGSTDAPLPVLGIRGLWKLPHNFYATAQAQSFYVDVDEYVGSLTDLKATLVWQATPHLGVGLGYNDFRFKFRIDRDLFSGKLRWNYGGAMAFVTVMY